MMISMAAYTPTHIVWINIHNFLTKNIIFTYHPITLENYSSKKQIKTILSVLEKNKEYGIIFTKSNSDPEGDTPPVAETAQRDHKECLRIIQFVRTC